MDIRQLRYFVEVAEAGSISRAADRCLVTQPSLSTQIRKLEDHLGVELFDRMGRGVLLTDAGRALLPKARRIIAQVHELEAGLASGEDDGGGRVVLGAIPTMAPYVLPPVLAQMRESFPACELIIREDLTQNLVEAVADNELDLAIASTPIDHDLIDTEVIGKEELLVVAPSDHVFTEDEAVSLPDLREQPAITLHEMHCLGRQVDEFCSTKRLASNIVCRMTQVQTLLEFVRLGLGVSIMPEMVAQHDQSPDRTYLRFKRNPPVREISLLWRRGRQRSRRAQDCAKIVRSLIDALK